MFAQFQCTYHNQFHRAFPDEASLTIAKQYWLGELQEHPPQVILAAARELTRKSVYLPSLAAVVQACSEGAGLLGLPDARRAYLEACGAPSPKRAFAWSHPVVYHAGRATGWQLLAREAESVALPVFEHYYARYCRQVLQGEDLELQPPPPLPAKTEQVLPREELQARLQQLRAQLKL